MFEKMRMQLLFCVGMCVLSATLPMAARQDPGVAGLVNLISADADLLASDAVG